MTAHIGDDVLGLDTGLLCRAAGFYALDVGTGGQVVPGSLFLVHADDADAQIGAGHITVVDQIGEHGGHVVNGNGEADALNAGAGIGGAGVLGGGDANHLAVHVEQGAAGVAGVDGGIGLNHADGGGAAAGGNLPVDAADVADGLGGGKLAQRIADSGDHIADGQVMAAAQGGGGQTGGLHLQNRHIVGGVLAHELGLVFRAVVGGDGERIRVLYHMAVGDDVAVLGENEAGAGGSAGGGAVDAVRGHGAGDGHHVVHAGGVELGGGHGTAVRGHGVGLAGAGGRVNLLLQNVQLLAQCLIPGLPTAVDGNGGNAAAGGYQNDYQHRCQHRVPDGSVMGLGFMGLPGGVLRRRSTAGMGHFVGRVGVGGRPSCLGCVGAAGFGLLRVRRALRTLGFRSVGGFRRGGLIFKVVVFKGFHILVPPCFYFPSS